MEYIKIADALAISNGEKKKIKLSDRDILLVKLEDQLYALDNKCPHMGGSLYEGIFSGTAITCPRHGASFDVKTGKNLKEAKIAFVKIKVDDAKSYPVKEEDGYIMLGLE